jgi:hypothetical protein
MFLPQPGPCSAVAAQSSQVGPVRSLVSSGKVAPRSSEQTLGQASSCTSGAAAVAAVDLPGSVSCARRSRPEETIFGGPIGTAGRVQQAIKFILSSSSSRAHSEPANLLPFPRTMSAWSKALASEEKQHTGGCRGSYLRLIRTARAASLVGAGHAVMRPMVCPRRDSGWHQRSAVRRRSACCNR